MYSSPVIGRRVAAVPSLTAPGVSGPGSCSVVMALPFDDGTPVLGEPAHRAGVVQRPDPRRPGGRLSDRVEAGAVEQQRVAAVALDVGHLAKDEDVVASVVGPPGPAGDGGRAAGQGGRKAALQPDDLLALGPAGEVEGELKLVQGQDVDRERLARQEPGGPAAPGHVHL